MKKTVFYFSSSLIQLIQVDTVKKSLMLSVEIPLPEGVIVKGELLNVDVVKQSIDKLVKSVKLTSVDVTIVFPENAVISKSLQIPNINIDEVDEAVRWEAESYLPFPLRDAVLDWKILTIDENSHILFQAVPKKVIDLYLKVFEDTNIEITAVETPAISMVRLIHGLKGSRLLVHISKSETVITLSKNDEVIATSIIPNRTNASMLIKDTLVHMLQYYQAFEINQIHVGGMGVTTKIIEQISSIGLKISGFNLPIPIKPQLANQFLIPLSAAFKYDAPPRNDKSINLLPLDYFNKKIGKDNKYFYTKIAIIFSISTFLLMVIILLVNFWMIKEESKLVAQHQNSSLIDKDTLSEVTKTNNIAKKIVSLSKDDYFPINIASKLESIMSNQITIYSLQLQIPEKKGDISGIAKDRVSLLAFKQAVEDIEGISQVVLPISSFTEEENIPFQLHFNIKDNFNKLETTILE